MNEITDLIYLYDDITRSYQVILQNSCEKDFLAYVEHVDGLLLKLTETRNECKRLKTALDAANKDITVLDSKLTSARRWLDAERQQRKKLENEKDSLSLIFDELRRLINNPGNKVPDETREKISSISKTLDIPSNIYRTPYDRLNTIAELESTSSNLSDVSISRSEDDILDDTRLNTRKHRPSYLDDEPISVKRRSGVVPPFTPTAPRVESLESSDSEYFVDEKLNANKENQSALISPFDRLYTRTHTFVEPSFFTAEYCSICEKTRLRRKNVRRCTDCNVVAHQECCEKVPLPCIPLCAPSKSGATGTIEDYAPLISPMVPALIVHSILEVERRRFKDMAIYKMPSTEKDVSTLKKKFFKCKGAPSLSNVDIHTICCCVKSFLKFDLRDTLIPKSKWYTFSKIILESNKVEKLCQAISSLPQANRDTLVFLILHLQKVAMSPDCKMSASDLANIFGPLLIEPFASEEVEASHSDKIVAELLKLPSERLIRLVTEPSTIPGTPYTLCHTPSTESLLRKTSRKFLTTPGGRRRFFNTPPFSK